MKAPSSRVLGWVFCAWLSFFWLGFFFLGRVPNVLGNRVLAHFPGRLAGIPDSAWLQQAAAWVVEHSPFRMAMIASRNRALLTVAGHLPQLPVNPGNAAVGMGRSGWLFLLDEAPGSRSSRELDTEVKNAVELAGLVAAGGRRFFLLPIPDKSSIYPEFTGTVLRWADRKSRRERLPDLMAAGFAATPAVRNCFISLWHPLLNSKKSGQGPLYWEHDTHWSPPGMLGSVRVLIEHLQPGLWDESAVASAGHVQHHGDLMESYLLQPLMDSSKDYSIVRPGPQPVRVKEQPPPESRLPPITRFHCDRPDVIKGRTLVISDSFIGLAVPLLSPWFEDVTFVHHDYTGSDELARCIRECDTLVFTSVERLLEWRLNLWNSTYKNYLLKALSAAPGQLDPR